MTPRDDPIERAAAAVSAAIRECMEEQGRLREQREQMGLSMEAKLKERGRDDAER